MRVSYDVKEEAVQSANGAGVVKTYAIVLRKGKRIFRSISNVFTSYQEANEFVSLCNRNKLDPIHLECVIEDYFCVC